LVAALTAAACDGGPADGTAAPAPAEPVIEVQTQLVARGSIAQRVIVPGSLVARRESRIGAEVDGRIVRIHVAEGDRVAEGQPLFEIDPDPYRAALRQAEAGLDLARAERLQLESDLRRTRELHREHVISEQQIERQESSLQVARARERQAQEAVALARQQVDRTVVAAPYPGSVAARLADEGTTAMTTPQTIVLVLQETAELEARAAVPESERASLRIGDRSRVHVEDAAAPIETTLSAVADTIDHATRTYLVKARVPNPDHALRAGVFARVEILAAPRSDVLVVPRDAIRTEEGETRVLAVRDGRAQPVAVQLGISTEEQAEVTAGLEAGEEIVVGESARTLAPGMRVRAARVAEADGP
jgi:RND family efflux transporter MFP subunit